MTEKSDLPRIPPPPPPPPPVTGRDPPARQTTTEETFLIERIPVRFVVVILVLPSEGSSRRAARWIAGSLSTLSGVAPRSRKAESSGWRCDCLSVRTSEGERKILVVFQFHRILLSLTLSESEVREGWMDEGVGPVLKWPLR